MGRSESGKSTFAYELHQKINFPLYHLDKYFFTDYWQERHYKEFIAIQQELVNQEQWIIGVFLRDSFIKKSKLMIELIIVVKR